MDCKEENQRTAMLVGLSGLERLQNAHVAVFGVGGVGGFVAEALARAGVGKIDLFDRDTVSLSNINRQIVALHSTVGLPKTEAMKTRIADINPDCAVTVHDVFYLPENADGFPLNGYTFVADCVDTVSAKVELALRASRAGVPLISAMGAGNRLDPSGFTVADLQKTEGCPLARVMRKELKERGLRHLCVAFSPDPVAETPEDAPLPKETGGKRSPASISYLPGIAGLLMAGEIIRSIASGSLEKHIPR